MLKFHLSSNPGIQIFFILAAKRNNCLRNEIMTQIALQSEQISQVSEV